MLYVYPAYISENKYFFYCFFQHKLTYDRSYLY